MTKTFLTCTNCGQRSSDTKRCKNCGQVFGRAPQHGEDSGAKRSWLPLLGVLGVAAIIALGVQRWSQRPLVVPMAAAPDTTAIAAPADTAVVATPAPAPPIQKEIPPAPVDTPRTVTPARVEPKRESLPQVADTARPAPSAKPVAIDVQRQRYATTWANVRAERNSGATVLQVLDRGEIVAIDSLENGWYRVTTDRPVVGYVDQQFLDTLPPAKP